jgi:hypothetical protein
MAATDIAEAAQKAEGEKPAAERKPAAQRPAEPDIRRAA